MKIQNSNPKQDLRIQKEQTFVKCKAYKEKQKIL